MPRNREWIPTSGNWHLCFCERLDTSIISSHRLSLLTLANSTAHLWSACLIESSCSTLFFLLFTFGRYGWPVAAPRFRSSCIHIADPYGHDREFFGKSSFTTHRPPVIKKDFERPPHRNPSADGQALTNDFGKTAALHQRCEKIAQSDSNC